MLSIFSRRSDSRSVSAPRVPILMYHRLGEVRADSIVPGHYVTQKLFESHLRLLRLLRMTPISLAELADGFAGLSPLPKRPVVITFDDGYDSFHRLGLPLLQKYRMKATVFLVSDLIGGLNRWDLAVGDVEEKLMDRAQIIEAESRGIEMGSHTCNHVHLPQLSPALAEEEIRRSRRDIESLLGHPVNFFCYPYGEENADIRALVAAAGYRGATHTQRHSNDAVTDPFAWGRINVRYNVTAWKLARRLLG